MKIDLKKYQTLYDKSDMEKVIERIPDQIRIAFSINIPDIDLTKYDQVINIGVGGSALSADILHDAFSDKLNIPVRTFRGYDMNLEKCTDSLFIINSFSGNTEETLHSFDRVTAFTDNVVVIASGGTLLNESMNRNLNVIRIPVENEPDGFQPRSALGYTVTLLGRLLFQNASDRQPLDEFKNVPDFLQKNSFRQEAEELAASLEHKIPVVITDESHLLSIARISKIKFNENSKVPAFYNALPEMNHNEMAGYLGNLAKFGLVYLHDPASNPRVIQRFNTMKKTFEKNGLEHVSFYSWSLPGISTIEKIFAALSFIDWCSYTLALINRVDPTHVDLIEKFKASIDE